MEIRSESVEGLQCIYLKGRLDIAGAQSIDLKFTTLTSTRRESVIVDLSEVDFISSIGIRLLLTNAKTLHLLGAKMVLVNPQRGVSEVLEQSGMHQLLPVVRSASDAVAILRHPIPFRSSD